MKSASAALQALLSTGNFVQGQYANVRFVPFDLYSVSLASGAALAYTTANFTIGSPPVGDPLLTAPAISGSGSAVPIGTSWVPMPIDLPGTKATAHWKSGLDSDTWTVEIAPRAYDPVTRAPYPDRIDGEPWLAAAAAGLLDNADCIVARAYFASLPTFPIAPGGAVPVGTVVLFRGVVGEIDMTTSTAILTINDYRYNFQQQMPRNLYMATCRHRLYDARCTLSSANFSATGAASSQSTRGTVVASSALPVPGGSGTFALGTVTMLGGPCQGFSRLVAAWDGAATLSLMNPFPYAPNPGDGFVVTAGCDKTTATCTLFNNLANYGGFPYIPAPEIALT